MLGKLFELNGSVIIPKEDCYILKPIANMMNKFPEDKLKLVAYLHYMCSMTPADNPYADVPEEDRQDQIVKDLELYVDLDDAIIRKALVCVQEKYYTTFYGMFTGIKAALDSVGKVLRTTKADMSMKDGNIANILNVAKSYEQLRMTYKAAYRDHEEETGSVRIRGGGKLAYDEDE